MAFRHPIIAVSHGPGPRWLLSKCSIGQHKNCDAAQNVRGIFQQVYKPSDPLPKRILFVSAHYSASGDGFEISHSESPDMIFDYHGFPSEAYNIKYPAKGDPEFAERVQSILVQHGLKSKTVDRGFDHGVFVPMALMRPQADIPIVTISINDNLGPEANFNVGQALAQFRDEDSLIIGSGEATHSLRLGAEHLPEIPKEMADFQSWLDEIVMGTELTPEQKKHQLTNWQSTAPGASFAHPTPDHFTPFVVATGAALESGYDRGEKLFGGWGMNHVSYASYVWK